MDSINLENILYQISIWALPVLFAITLHEVAHGYVADKLGDSTARALGRLTINPIKHIDPIGTLLIPAIMVILPLGFVFGWAKPIPVNTRNLANPRKDMALVAIAGPLANLAMAFAWGAFILLAYLAPDLGIRQGIVDMAQNGVIINVLLMVLNLLPLPPLDGGRVLAGVVPRNMANWLDRIEPYGFLIILVILVSGVFAETFGALIQNISLFILQIFVH
ncbi:MAG TPA: site-2 protease family protein [Thiothrix sp.]|nr:site-2 protease family protein [Thiothrix sp.]